MERPTIKDKNVDKYVSYLEDQLANFKTDTTNVRLYLGVKKQVDNMALLLNQDKVEVPAPTVEEPDRVRTVSIMSMETLSSKDDKFMDRFTKIMDKFLEYSDNLSKAAEKINPKILSDLEKQAKKESGSIYERVIDVK